MRVSLQPAGVEDVPDLVALRLAVSARLAAKYGNGFWVSRPTERGALFALRHSSVYIARDDNQLIATLTLATKKPWAIDRKYFASGKRPLYLTAMAVHPDVQGQGIGRRCIEEARLIALQWPGDAIRLDAYDAAAGAGGFYGKCGFDEVGRAPYRGVPHIYFEMRLGTGPAGSQTSTYL